MTERDLIVLSGMEFHSRHGDHREEESLGARYTVGVELELPLSEVDELSRTADYSRIYSLVRELVTGSRHKLIESLAATVARRILESEALVDAVTVRVHKPHAPLPGVVRDVYAQVTRRRE